MDRRALIGIALVAASAGSAAAAPSSDNAAPANSYISLDSVNGSVVRANGRRGILTVDVGVDVPDGALRVTAAASRPRLRAEMSRVVQTFAAALRPGDPPDVDRLSRELQFAVNQALGRRGARVLLGTVMIA